MSENRHVLRQNLLPKNLAITTILVLTFSIPSSASNDSSCRDSVPLAAGETWRDAGTAAGAARCFDVDVPAAGILALGADVGAFAAAEPRLFAADGACRPHRPASGALVLAEGASYLTLWAPAGTHRFCVGAQDPRQGLGSFRLSTGFLELGLGLAGGLKNDDGSGNGEDPREIEAEPEAGFFAGGLKNDDGSGNGEDPREIEAEPEAGFFAGGLKNDDGSGNLPRKIRAALCRHPSGGDDHGDTFLCATELTRGNVAGELGNAWGDDADVFALTVTSAATLEIRSAGAIDTFGSLYDRRGQRLAAGDDGGGDGNFRLVKTLLPGRYFVRVESPRYDQGGYRLLIAAAGGGW